MKNCSQSVLAIDAYAFIVDKESKDFDLLVADFTVVPVLLDPVDDVIDHAVGM